MINPTINILLMQAASNNLHRQRMKSMNHNLSSIYSSSSGVNNNDDENENEKDLNEN
jgi:hypothetical protein